MPIFACHPQSLVYFNDLLHDLEFDLDVFRRPKPSGDLHVKFLDSEMIKRPDVPSEFLLTIHKVEEVKIEGDIEGAPGGMFNVFKYKERERLLVMKSCYNFTIKLRVARLFLELTQLAYCK
jgi:hypothetical protein